MSDIFPETHPGWSDRTVRHILVTVHPNDASEQCDVDGQWQVINADDIVSMFDDGGYGGYVVLILRDGRLPIRVMEDFMTLSHRLGLSLLSVKREVKP